MRSSSKGPMFAIVGLAIWAGPSAAADNSAALRCAALADDQARLACYDGLFRATDASVVPQATAADAAQAGGGSMPAPKAKALPPADPVADFGLTPAQQRALDPERAEENRAPDSVTGTVAAVGFKKLSGEMVVTLQNGQVWVQIDTGNKPRIKTGDTVTIKRGSLGSYLLVSPSGAATRVRRLK